MEWISMTMPLNPALEPTAASLLHFVAARVLPHGHLSASCWRRLCRTDSYLNFHGNYSLQNSKSVSVSFVVQKQRVK